MKIGIVGLPNVGKSTLFNALTKKSVPAENYPFCTIDPSVGVVAVPDERLDKLSEFSKSKKTIPAAVEFVDIAGLVKGASVGEGLGNKFLSHIREVDAIAQVVRNFKDDKITHVEGKIEPLSDIEIINLELVMADLETVNKRLSNIEREAKTGSASRLKEVIFEKEILLKLKANLEQGKAARQIELNEKEKSAIKGLHLLSIKPTLYVLNVSEAGDKSLSDLSKIPGEYLEIDAIFGKGLDEFIKKSYELLKLITFFTTGEDETRAWTIKQDSTAPIAGAAIHSDFRDKFIRAEVINWQKLLEVGSYAAAREKGLIRTEGKQYIVQDGDVVEFKI